MPTPSGSTRLTGSGGQSASPSRSLASLWPEGTRILWALTVLAGVWLFVPWRPLQVTNYYEYCIHVASEKGWQFGTDIITTYGPLGFVGLPLYRASTYPFMIVANLLLYGMMVVFLWQYWRELVAPTRPPALWMVSVVLLPGFAPSPEWSATLFLPCLLVNIVVLTHFLAERPPGFLHLLPLTAALGVLVLVKGMFLPLSFLAVAAVAVDQVISWRLAPWIVPAFAAAVFLSWCSLGQSPTHMVAYFASTFDLIAGYKDGMGFSNASTTGAWPVLFASAILGLAGTFWWTISKRLGWRSIGPASVLAATLFVVFQHGFVRGDGPHMVVACLSVCSVCTLVTPVLWRWFEPTGAPRFVPASFPALGLFLVLFCWLSGNGTPEWRVLLDRAAGLSTLARYGTAPLEAAAAAHFEELKRENPLPLLKEPLDCSAVDIGLAEANGLELAVRPTLALYASNTAGMSRRNREFIEDASGPAMILMPATVSIDDRLPATTDSQGLLAQKTHFQTVGNNSRFLVLERRAKPLGLSVSSSRNSMWDSWRSSRCRTPEKTCCWR